jgi:glyoxylase-like metal-dependent hydrolase (beta-lactamase superfamily II)
VPITTAFFDQATSTLSYVVYDAQSLDAILIDPVLDYDPSASVISTNSLMRLRTYIKKNKLRVRLILDTHVHADHMSGAFYAKKIFAAPRAIGEDFRKSQAYFAPFFGLEDELKLYEPAYDFLLKHNQITTAGSLSIKTLLTPGHTPSCSSFLIDDALFVGDALFMPELGCGRTDFPGANAQTLYYSVKNYIYTCDEQTKIYVGHDYPAAQAEPRFMSTVGESKQKNIMLDNHISEEEFIFKRQQKDQTLQPPKLLIPAMQINILGGQLPQANKQEQRFLRLPLSLNFLA